jgi:hypothetical protein
MRSLRSRPTSSMHPLKRSPPKPAKPPTYQMHKPRPAAKPKKTK